MSGENRSEGYVRGEMSGSRHLDWGRIVLLAIAEFLVNNKTCI